MTRQNGVGQRNAGFGRAGLGVFQAANSSVVRSVSQESGLSESGCFFLLSGMYGGARRGSQNGVPSASRETTVA